MLRLDDSKKGTNHRQKIKRRRRSGRFAAGGEEVTVEGQVQRSMAELFELPKLLSGWCVVRADAEATDHIANLVLPSEACLPDAEVQRMEMPERSRFPVHLYDVRVYGAPQFTIKVNMCGQPIEDGIITSILRFHVLEDSGSWSEHIQKRGFVAAITDFLLAMTRHAVPCTGIVIDTDPQLAAHLEARRKSPWKTGLLRGRNHEIVAREETFPMTAASSATCGGCFTGLEDVTRVVRHRDCGLVITDPTKVREAMDADGGGVRCDGCATYAANQLKFTKRKVIFADAERLADPM